MTLTVHHYDTTVTVSHKRDDLSINETVELMRTLLLAMGFHPDNVKQAFGEE